MRKPEEDFNLNYLRLEPELSVDGALDTVAPEALAAIGGDAERYLADNEPLVRGIGEILKAHHKNETP